MQGDGPSSCFAGHIQQRQAGSLVPVPTLPVIAVSSTCSCIICHTDHTDRLFLLGPQRQAVLPVTNHGVGRSLVPVAAAFLLTAPAATEKRLVTG